MLHHLKIIKKLSHRITFSLILNDLDLTIDQILQVFISFSHLYLIQIHSWKIIDAEEFTNIKINQNQRFRINWVRFINTETSYNNILSIFKQMSTNESFKQYLEVVWIRGDNYIDRVKSLDDFSNYGYSLKKLII